MTLPANIRLNVKASFPSLVTGSGMVVVTKNNGVWTISVDYTKLAQLPVLTDLPTSLIVIYDPTTKQYNTVTASQILAGSVNSYRGPITAAGDITVLPTDVVILVAKTVPAATNILLPTSVSRNGVPLTVKDYGGNGQANNYRFVMAGSETLDGFTQSQADGNGASKISVNWGKKTLFPLTSGGWYL